MVVFFFNDTATTEIYTLSLHDALPICTNADDLGDHRPGALAAREHGVRSPLAELGFTKAEIRLLSQRRGLPTWNQPSSPCLDRKSTRLNSSHANISYAVFCLKKKIQH